MDNTPPSHPTPALAVLQAWADAFNATDLAAIVALYAEDALLWGTTAQAVIDSPAGVRAYFAAVFSLQPPPRVQVTQTVARGHADTTVIAGAYTLQLPGEGGAATHWPARYSFTLQRAPGRWLIAAHHSSLLPSGPLVAARQAPAAPPT